MEKKNGKRPFVDLVEQARQARLRAEEMAKQAAELERAVQLARGTERVKSPQTVTVKPSRGEYWVGDAGTTEELMATIHKILLERPRRFVELLEATGARDNRIKGVIMRLQREGVRVVDVAPPGTGKALWFIPSDDVLQRIMRAKRATVSR